MRSATELLFALTCFLAHFMMDPGRVWGSFLLSFELYLLL